MLSQVPIHSLCLSECVHGGAVSHLLLPHLHQLRHQPHPLRVPQRKLQEELQKGEAEGLSHFVLRSLCPHLRLFFIAASR